MQNNQDKPFIRSGNLFLATSPSSDYKDLTDELKSEKFVGKVHIDLVLKLGFCSNRFVEIYFNGTEFVKKSVGISSKPSQLFQFTLYILKNNSKLLENSILSRGNKDKIKAMI